MQAHCFIIGLALIMLSGCQRSLMRDSMPAMTRTGEVQDVVIKDTLSPTTVRANPGDEIRWINKRQGDIEVIFSTPLMEKLTCQRNFGIVGSEQNQYAAQIDTNDTASVCFQDPIELKYLVKAESNDSGGEESFPGRITIGSESRLGP